MATNCAVQFYYPLPARTSFAALNCNVTAPRTSGTAVVGEALNGAETTELRRMLVECEDLREVLRWSILRCKYHRNVAFSYTDSNVTLAQRDCFMEWAERLYGRELYYVAAEREPLSMPSGAPELATSGLYKDSSDMPAPEFLKKPKAIAKLAMRAHRQIRTAALAYASKLRATMSWIEARAEFCAWWTTSRRRFAHTVAQEQEACGFGGAVPLSVFVSTSHASSAPGQAERTDSAPAVPYVPVFRWLGSSALVHKRSRAAMIDTSFAYDHAMALAVVLFADLNMAETSARLLSTTTDVEPNGAIEMYERASGTCTRVLDAVEHWIAAPSVESRHAELQPFVLSALREYCLAQRIYYGANLNRTMLGPSEFVSEFSKRCISASLGQTSSDFGPNSPLLKCSHLNALVCYNVHLCRALTHYNRQLLDNAEFGCFIHTLSCVALSRIAYVQIMLRSIQCISLLRETTNDEREAFTKRVLDPYETCIATQKSMLEYKCRGLRVWSSKVDEHSVCVRPNAHSNATFGATSFRRPTIHGYHPSFVDVRKLYAVCSNAWDMLHTCQMHLRLCAQL